MSPRRVGILGGSFDPVHDAHLELARRARHQLGLDELWLLPAASPPHKDPRALSPAHHRRAMLELAAAGQADLSICTLELDEPERRYTVDTLRRLAELHPDLRWYLVIGEDSFRQLDSWRDPAELARRVEWVVCPRPGSEGPRPLSYRGARVHWLAGEPLDLSSTSLRAALGRGGRPRGMAPAVVDYAIEHGLYREGPR